MSKTLPIYLSGKDVSKALQVSIATAYRRLADVRLRSQTPAYKKVSVLDFCNFYNIPLEQFYQNLV